MAGEDSLLFSGQDAAENAFISALHEPPLHLFSSLTFAGRGASVAPWLIRHQNLGSGAMRSAVRVCHHYFGRFTRRLAGQGDLQSHYTACQVADHAVCGDAAVGSIEYINLRDLPST